MTHQPSLTRYAWLSIGAALVTMGLKTGAYFLTGSVGLLSDAMESVVNLATAIVALIALSIAARPADEEHAYGHGKVEYFSSGLEGALILVAAGTIAYTAMQRLIDPQPLEQVGLGLAISTVASVINFAVARVLMRAGKRHSSITLEADAQHLMTDVWTSIGVIVGVAAVALTGWQRLDPIIALLVAVNIVWAGAQLLRRSALGLIDTALPVDDLAKIESVLARYRGSGVAFHALRTRQAGMRRFVSVHVLVPGAWTVLQGHHLAEQIEHDLSSTLPNTTVFTHIEPLEDPSSWDDTQLDRTSLTAEAARGPG